MGLCLVVLLLDLLDNGLHNLSKLFVMKVGFRLHLCDKFMCSVTYLIVLLYLIRYAAYAVFVLLYYLLDNCQLLRLRLYSRVKGRTR